MAYETGPATGLDDLVDKLAIFAAAQGWTITRDNGTELCLNDGKTFQNSLYDSVAGTWKLKLAQQWDNTKDWNDQPEQSRSEQQSNQLLGSFSKYHFFSNVDGDYIHVVIEVNSGFFRHIAFGQMEHLSPQVGGSYSAAVYQSTSSSILAPPLFQADLNDLHGGHPRAPQFLVETPETGTGPLGLGVWADMNAEGNHLGDVAGRATDFIYNYYLSGKFYDWHWYCSPTTFNQLIPLTPIQFMVSRPDGLWSMVGTVRDIRNIRITELVPGSTITIGSDNWIVFPPTAKNTGNNASGTFYGYAYKIIP